MMEPTKISMLERGRLVKLVEDLVKFCEENFPTSTVLYVEMYPRFMERCCEKISHMTKDDPWVLDNSRREIERELRIRIEGSCEIVSWCEAAGLDKEPELQQIRKMEVVGRDGVHLSLEYCKRAAVHLCSRLSEEEVVLRTDGLPEKRRRRW